MKRVRLRPTARVFLLDPTDRVLLFDTELTYTRVWMTPGGGVKSGESFEQAALRELWEETGVPDAELGPCVCTVRFRFELSGELVDQDERYFVARAANAELRPGGLEPGEMDEIKSHRWWTAAEIAASTDHFRPRSLADLLPAILSRESASESIEAEVEACARLA